MPRPFALTYPCAVGKYADRRTNLRRKIGSSLEQHVLDVCALRTCVSALYHASTKRSAQLTSSALASVSPAIPAPTIATRKGAFSAIVTSGVPNGYLQRQTAASSCAHLCDAW
jgi:hypothetical protein